MSVLTMRMHVFLLVVFLWVVPQTILASHHHVPYNVATTIDLQDGDEIVLENMPFDWAFSRVVLGVNSMPSLPLSGALSINNCQHLLHEYYEQIDFTYVPNIIIKYRGPSQALPIHWWVDGAPLESSCLAMSREDSLWQFVRHYADSIYNKKISRYSDLGVRDTYAHFSGRSEHVKISDLPKESYNRIYVSIEPEDGRELKGHVYVGNRELQLKGWSSGIALTPMAGRIPTFEIVFPEYRKFRVKWWAVTERPGESIVEPSETQMGGDSVLVRYNYAKTPFSRGQVQLAFDRNSFTDGKVPVVKKLDFNPYASIEVDGLVTMGNVYDIHANLREGDTITMALPLDFDYVSGQDTVVVGHFNESMMKWVEEPVDSIVDNIAYFRATSFSFRSLFRKACKVVNKVVVYTVCPACGIASIADEDFADAVDNFTSKWATVQVALVDGTAVDFVIDLVANLKCLNIERLKEQGKSFVRGVKSLFSDDSDDSKSSDWSIDQGKLSKKVKEDPLLIRALENKRNQALVNYSKILLDLCEQLSNSLKVQTGQAGDCSEDLSKVWEETNSNLEILLADVILSEVSEEDRRFELSIDDSDEMIVKDKKIDREYKFSDYFKTNEGLLKDASDVVSGLRGCYGAGNVTGKIVDKWSNIGSEIKNLNLSDACSDFFSLIGFSDVFDEADQSFTCLEFLSNVGSAQDLLDGHVNKLLAMSDIMTRVSLLSWIDKDVFRKYAAVAYKSIYDGSLAWLELAGPLMEYNNVIIKAYASLALFEYINYGTLNNLNMLNAGLTRHYGDRGGFSEGTGYSQFVWDDVTYLLASLKQAYKDEESKNLDISARFLKSPDYMFDFSRPVKDFGRIPVEIDDGCTYNPDYRVWAKIKDDPKYLTWAENMPLKEKDGKINVLVPFGFPEQSLYNEKPKSMPSRGKIWSDNTEGLMLITVKNKSGDTVALSMVAEAGKMWNRGQSHDQQDNLSITLTSKNNGFIIQDRGYSGFDNRGSTDGFHRSVAHNVLLFGEACADGGHTACNIDNSQSDNQNIDMNEVRDRLSGFSGQTSGLWWTFVSAMIDYWNIGENYFKVEGGSEVFSLDSVIDPGQGVIGYTASLTLFNNTIAETEIPHLATDARSILFFGGNFWVIDQPSEKGLVWQVNSPRGANWIDLGINLYGSELSSIGNAGVGPINILQNGSRTDYITKEDGKNYLLDYWYVVRDGDANSYVMTYVVDDEGFEKTDKKCPKDFQCFRNRKDNKRLIVPPLGKKYEAASVLGNRYRGYPETDGIMLAVRADDGVWDYRVLRGKTYGDYQSKYLAGVYKLLLLSR